jgi:carbonic anhydrase
MRTGWWPRTSGESSTRPREINYNFANKTPSNSSEAEEELKARKLDFLPFPEIETAVKDDVSFLKSSKLVPDSVTISGWVYEVETGKTRRVL